MWDFSTRYRVQKLTSCCILYTTDTNNCDELVKQFVIIQGGRNSLWQDDGGLQRSTWLRYSWSTKYIQIWSMFPLILAFGTCGLSGNGEGAAIVQGMNWLVDPYKVSFVWMKSAVIHIPTSPDNGRHQSPNNKSSAMRSGCPESLATRIIQSTSERSCSNVWYLAKYFCLGLVAAICTAFVAMTTQRDKIPLCLYSCVTEWSSCDVFVSPKPALL